MTQLKLKGGVLLGNLASHRPFVLGLLVQARGNGNGERLGMSLFTPAGAAEGRDDVVNLR
jgi:hypothetical protein